MNRFTKIGADGAALPDDAAEWVAVRDNISGLLWSANDVGTEELDWKHAKKACATLELCEQKDWRLPTVEELFALADRSRFNPSIDTAFFPTAKKNWYWSSTPVASSPADYAWDVVFSSGGAGDDPQNGTAFVRACRSASPASQ